MALRQWIQTHANRLPGVPPFPGLPPHPHPHPHPLDSTPPVPAPDELLPLAWPPTIFETVWSSVTVQSSGQIDQGYQDILPINLENVTLGSLYPSARGSFAIVWKGRWKGQYVALKQLKPEDSETDARVS